MCEQKTEVKKGTKILYIILFIIFAISLLPYLLPTYYSIEGVSFLWSDKDYGFDAWLFSFIVLCVRPPIFPITITYQFFFMVFPFRKLSKFLKKVAIVTIIVTLAITLIPPTVIDILEYSKSQAKYYHDKATIEEYLTDQYGEELSNDMRVTFSYDKNYNSYQVKSKLLNDTFEVYLEEDGLTDEFDYVYCKENKFSETIENDLKKNLNLPDNFELSICNIDIKDYSDLKDIDKTIASCEYTFDDLIIRYNYYDKQTVIDDIKEFYIKHGNKLKLDNADSDWPTITICIDEEKFACIYVHTNENDNSILRLSFDYENHSITDECIEITVNE